MPEDSKFILLVWFLNVLAPEVYTSELSVNIVFFFFLSFVLAQYA